MGEFRAAQQHPVVQRGSKWHLKGQGHGCRYSNRVEKQHIHIYKKKARATLIAFMSQSRETSWPHIFHINILHWIKLMVPRLQCRRAQSVQLTSQIEHFNEMCCAPPFICLTLTFPRCSVHAHRCGSAGFRRRSEMCSEGSTGAPCCRQRCSPKHRSLHGSKRIPCH